MTRSLLNSCPDCPALIRPLIRGLNSVTYLLLFICAHFAGTQHYCPPEFYSHHCFLASHATVWQLGFLLAEMLSGEMPYVKPRMALYMHPSIPKFVSKGKNI